ncbi:NAD(P)-binding protein [Lojkania enalia]|uniref:NAD(P)-binding protein n=1 Tax=Lojkania enalia TaxID=147567 RepID=A0A9P4N8Y4_9PLEO|nr:NAD(P)-binding protein [Didymosphaeria enalia]
MKAWHIRSPIHGHFESALFLNQSARAPDVSSLAPGQILIKVLSAAINPIDYKAFDSGWLGRNGIVAGASPGLDFCGRVLATHPLMASSLTSGNPKEGNLVFGSLAKAQKFGSLGEFMIVPQTECTALPEGVQPDDAAALGTAAGSALEAFPSHLFKPGGAVFINGGSGGVGTYAIQIAKLLGASRVVTACSTANVELCKSLGASEVLDYKSVDVIPELRRRGQVFDLVIDNVGTPGLWAHCDEYVKPGGGFVQVAATPSIGALLPILRYKLQSFLPGPKHRGFYFVMSKGGHERFEQLGGWLAEGKLKSVIGETFEFEDVPKAYEKLKKGHARGKIVIHVAKE